jgi:DNA invertase Pin-like site-specific DNA recombinase
MRVGYCRVSSSDQNLDTQIERLKAEGCEKLFAEKISGASNIEDREQWQACLDFVREGDELVMLRLDRLTRGGIVETLEALTELDKRGVRYRFLDHPNIDTTSTAGRLVTAIFAEVSHAFLVELKAKQKAGIALARQKGVYKGRRPVIPKERVIELRASGMGPAAIAREMRCSEASVFRILNSNGHATVAKQSAVA